MTPGEPQADDDNVRCQWGSQSWLQPAFSRPLPGTTARSSPESRLKGVPRGDPRARLPAPRLFSSKALPCASAGGRLELLQYFVQRDLDPRQQVAVDRLGLPCGREPRATIYPSVPQFRVDYPYLGGAMGQIVRDFLVQPRRRIVLGYHLKIGRASCRER